MIPETVTRVLNTALSALMLTVGCASTCLPVSGVCWLPSQDCIVYDNACASGMSMLLLLTEGRMGLETTQLCQALLQKSSAVAVSPYASIWAPLPVQEGTHKGSLNYAVSLCITALHKAAETGKRHSGRCLLVPCQASLLVHATMLCLACSC